MSAEAEQVGIIYYSTYGHIKTMADEILGPNAGLRAWRMGSTEGFGPCNIMYSVCPHTGIGMVSMFSLLFAWSSS